MFFKNKQKTKVKKIVNIKADVQTAILQYTFADNTTFKQKVYGHTYKSIYGTLTTHSALEVAQEILRTGAYSEILRTGAYSGLRNLIEGETLIVDDTLNPSVSVVGKIRRIEIVDIKSYFIDVEVEVEE